MPIMSVPTIYCTGCDADAMWKTLDLLNICADVQKFFSQWERASLNNSLKLNVAKLSNDSD